MLLTFKIFPISCMGVHKKVFTIVVERLVEFIITSLYSAFGSSVVAVDRSGAFE